MKLEDVIRALRCVAEDGECDCNACAYAEDGNPTPWCQCQKKAAGDAVKMLGRQKPGRVHDIDIQSDGRRKGYCPACGMKLESFYNSHYCGTCGLEVKWE